MHFPDTTQSPLERVPFSCRICGKAVWLDIPAEGSQDREMFEKLARTTATHDACRDGMDARTRANWIMNAQKKAVDNWAAICPEEFRKDLRAGSKGYNSARLKMVLEWKYGEMGLRLIGPSGKCKTRFAFQLLKREFDAGRKVGAVMHGEFRHKASALAAAGQDHLKAYIEGLYNLELLLIDDLGKGRATPAAEEAFYLLIDARSAKCRPTLFTMNTPLNDFLSTLSEEYRAPLLRRFEDKTTLIQF